MKTLNTKEDIPKHFYIFTNRNESSFWNQCENHNITLRDGMLISSGFYNALCLDNNQKEKFLTGDLIYAPFIPNTTTNIGSVSPFSQRLIQRYSLEYGLEYIRYTYYKTYPSRFSCIFAFGTLNDCINFSKGKKTWNLGSLKKFELLLDDNFNKYIKVIKANFKFIGLMENYPTSALSFINQEFLYRHYWEGKGRIKLPEIKIDNDILIEEKNCGNLHEYLIEGILKEIEFTQEEKDIINSLK